MVLGRKAKLDFTGLTGFLADQQRLFQGSRCDGYDPLTDNASFSRSGTPFLRTLSTFRKPEKPSGSNPGYRGRPECRQGRRSDR